MPTGREIRLAARPTGMPQPRDFTLAEVDVPDPAAGEVLVRNLWMSVDPYMRPRMNDAPSYVPAYELDPVRPRVVAATRQTCLAPPQLLESPRDVLHRPRPPLPLRQLR